MCWDPSSQALPVQDTDNMSEKRDRGTGTPQSSSSSVAALRPGALVVFLVLALSKI